MAPSRRGPLSDFRAMVGSSRTRGFALLGAGLSFATILLVFAYVGHLADERLGTDPWLLAVGSLVGMILATWELLRVANAAERQHENDE